MFHLFYKMLSRRTTIVSYLLLSEIRSLDSEMQTLVYENYNKFISATDTIRKVKCRSRVCIVRIRVHLEKKLGSIN